MNLSGVHIADLIANLPAASENGRLFFATDTGAIYRDSGTAWVVIPIATQAEEFVNAQTGTSYTVANGDLAGLVTFSNASAIAVTLPRAMGGGAFGPGWFVDVRNLGAGTVTITPTTSTINGASTLVLTTNQSVRIVSDGTNYQVTNLVSASGGTVTHTGALTSGLPVLGNGTADITIGTKTGSGDVVFATSPTLITPILGTPTSGTLTNCTGLPESGVTGLVSDLALKAPLASPTFTGTPAAPTPLTADNSTTLATTAYVKAQGFGTSSLAKYTTTWSSQTSVTVTHGLATTAVIVQVFDAGGVLVVPESVTVTSSSVVTLTFGAAFTGSVVVIG